MGAIDQLFTINQTTADDACFRCGKPLRSVKPPAKASRQFKEMTGRTFPWPSISLNVEADSKSLGVAGVLGRGSFCCGCAVEYMTVFNRFINGR